MFLAELKETGHHFAIKAVTKAKLLADDNGELDFLMVEKRVLELGINHPYITQLHCTFQTQVMVSSAGGVEKNIHWSN